MPTHAKAKFYQPLVACIEDGVEHRFVKEEVAHPLGDDDVHLVHGELHLLDLALDERDDCCGVRECVSRHGGARKRKKKNFGTIAEAVVGDNLLGLVDDGRAVNLFVCVCGRRLVK